MVASRGQSEGSLAVVSTGMRRGCHRGHTLNHCSTWATSARKATRSGFVMSGGEQGDEEGRVESY